MTSDALESLRARVRDIDRDLLRALGVRARFPRNPRPVVPEAARDRPCPPPLAELLIAIAPAGIAGELSGVEPANRELVAALLARQSLANQIAEAKYELVRADARDAMATGDRDKLIALLTDLPAELRLLDFVRAVAAEVAPDLPAGLAPLLWREYVIPWTKRSEAAHLLEP